MMDACLEAVPAEFISINDIAPVAGGRVVAVVRPDLPGEVFAEFAKYVQQNPLLDRYLQTRDGRAYRFSDVITAEELRELDLYKHVYAPIGVEYQMAFMLASPEDRVLAVVLSRSDKDFTDAERDFFDRARPFLIQAWSNAIEHSELRDQLLGQSGGDVVGGRPLSELMGRGLTRRQAEVLVMTARGRSNKATAEALSISERTVQKHLERCYRTLGIAGRSEASDLVWALIAESAAGPAGRRGLELHRAESPG